MKKVPGSAVQSSASTPGEFAMSTPSATSMGVKASEGTASPGASIKSSPSVSNKDEVDEPFA